MKKLTYIACLPALLIAGCDRTDPPANDSAAASEAGVSLPQAYAVLNSAGGDKIGEAKIVLSSDRPEIRIAVSGLGSGEHGFHLHEAGDCIAPDFKSAGGHLNPLGKSHGRESENGAHLGDLPNIHVDANGSGRVTAPLGAKADSLLDWLFDEDGTAVVIHADPDDYSTDPSGNAGARIACGVLMRSAT